MAVDALWSPSLSSLLSSPVAALLLTGAATLLGAALRVSFRSSSRSQCGLTLHPLPGSLLKLTMAWVLVASAKTARNLVRRLGFNSGPLDVRHTDGRPVEALTSDSPLWNDSFYFWLSQKDGRVCVSARLGFVQRGRGSDVEANPWLVVSVDGTSYALDQPVGSTGAKAATSHRWQLDASHTPASHTPASPIYARRGEQYLEFVCLEGMRHWRLRYDGPVYKVSRLSDGDAAPATTTPTTTTATTTTATTVHLCFEATLELDASPFHYQRHWDALAAASAMSTMQWSRQYFKQLRGNHQEHYENGLTAQGKVTLGGHLRTLEDCIGFRDHSYGPRNWTYMLRYMWCGTVCLETPIVNRSSGCAYTHLALTAVDYGTTFKHLVAGGLTGVSAPVLPITGMTHMKDVVPAWYGATGRGSALGGIGHMVPSHVSFDARVNDGDMVLRVKVKRNGWKHSFLLQDGSFEVHEGFAVYTIRVLERMASGYQETSTVQGHGLLEFGGRLES